MYIEAATVQIRIRASGGLLPKQLPRCRSTRLKLDSLRRGDAGRELTGTIEEVHPSDAVGNAGIGGADS